MRRRALLLALPLTALAACAPPPPMTLGPDGRPLPRIYRISAEQEPEIQLRALHNLNAVRQAAGVPQLALNGPLNAAAAMHSRDMSRQGRPWNFGSDGSSPLDRAARAGFPGQVIGETISESFETELETIGAWLEAPTTRSILLHPAARAMGLSFYQEPNGKIWWTMVLGA